jgi:hypothetical protein
MNAVNIKRTEGRAVKLINEERLLMSFKTTNTVRNVDCSGHAKEKDNIGLHLNI